MKRKLMYFASFLILMLTLIATIGVKSTPIVASAQDMMHVRYVAEDLSKNVKTTFAPGETFKLLVYGTWTADVKSVQVNVRPELKRGVSYADKLEPLRRPSTKGGTDGACKPRNHGYNEKIKYGQTTGTPKPTKNPGPSTYDSRLDFTITKREMDEDGDEISTTYGFFDQPTNRIDDNSIYNAQYIGGTFSTTSARLDMTKETLLGIVEYQIKANASGEIKFDKTHTIFSGVRPNGNTAVEFNCDTLTINIAAPSNNADLETLFVEDEDFSRLIPAISGQEIVIPREYEKNQVKLKGTVKESGTISEVSVNGKVIGITNGYYNIPLGNPGETTKVTVKTLSSSKSGNKTYTVNIKRAPNKSNDLTNLDVSSEGGQSGIRGKLTETFSPTKTNYIMNIPSDATNVLLTPTFDTTQGITVTVDGQAATSGQQIKIPASKTSITIACRSQSGAVKNYVVNIHKQSVDTRIESVSFNAYEPGQSTGRNILGNNTGNVYQTTSNYKFKETGIGLIVTLPAGSNSTFTIDNQAQQSGVEKKGLSFGQGEYQKTFKVIVTAEAGNKKSYDLVVNRDNGNSDTSIMEARIQGTYANPTITDYGTFTGNGPFTIGNTTPVSYDEKELIATIRLNAETSYIVFNGQSLPYKLEGNPLTLKLDGKNQSYTFTFDVVSETGVRKTYQIVVNREVPSNDTKIIPEIKGGNTDKVYALNGTSPSFTASLPISEVYAKVFLKGIEGKKVFVGSNPNAASITTPYNPVGFKINVGETGFVKVVARDGSETVYTFRIDQTIEKNTDNTIKNIEIIIYKGSSSTAYIIEDYTFISTQKQYNLIVDYPYTSIEFNVELPNGATLANGSVNLRENLNVGQNGPFLFRCKAEDGSLSPDTYSFNITRNDGDKDNTLSELKINGVAVELKQYQYDYTVVLPHGAQSATVEYKATSPKAKTSASPATNVVTLTNNKGSYSINVRSEVDIINSAIGNNYRITIYSASQKAEITNIQILQTKGSQDNVVDITNQPFTFSKETTNYTFTVPFVTSKVYVKVTYDDQYSRLFGVDDQDSTINVGDNNFEIYNTSEYGLINSQAENTSSKIYRINIKRKQGSSNASLANLSVKIDGIEQITNFSSENYSYVINNVAKDKMFATIEATLGEGLKIEGPTGQVALPNKSNPFTLTVLAQDGKTKKTYTIVINKEGIDGQADNTVLNITATDNFYNEHVRFNPETLEYNIKLPYNATGLTFRVSKPTDSNATLHTFFNGNEETLTDGTKVFTNVNTIFGQDPKEVIIYAKNAQAQEKGTEYKFIITMDVPDSDNTLESIHVGDQVFNNPTPGATNPIIAYVQFGTTVVDIEGFLPAGSTATVQSGKVSKPLQAGPTVNTHVITVTAQDGSINEYHIHVFVGMNPNELLLEYGLEVRDANKDEQIKFTEGKFDPTVKNYNVEVNPDVTEIEIIARQVQGVKVEGIGVKPLVFANPTDKLKFEVIVSPYNGEYGDPVVYTITVSKKAIVDPYLESIEFKDQDNNVIAIEPTFDKNTLEYNMYVGRNVSSFTYTEVHTPGSIIKVAINDLSLDGGKNNVKTITVGAPNTSKERTYKFNIYVASDRAEINNVEFKNTAGQNLSDSFIFNKEQYIGYDKFVVENKVNTIKLFIESLDQYAKVYVNGVEYNIRSPYFDVTKTGDNEVVIVAKSEMNVLTNGAKGNMSQEYRFVVSRADVSSDSTLKTLNITLSDGTVLKDLSGVIPTIITLQNVETTAPSVTINATPNDPHATVIGTGIKDISKLPSGQTQFTFTITVTASDSKTTSAYTIYLVRNDLVLDKDRTVNNIMLFDNENNQYINNFSIENKRYEVVIPFGPKSYTIQAIFNKVTSQNGGNKLVKIDGVEAIGGSNQFTIGADRADKEHTVQCIAADGTEGEIYTIVVKFEKPSNDLGIQIELDGVLLPGFNPEKLSYFINKPSNYESASFTAIANDPKSSIAANFDITKPNAINYGNNVFVITITAQSGDVKQYTITINRAYPKPKLVDLGVLNNHLTPEFDPEITDYKLSVPYSIDKATIYCVKENERDRVIGDGDKQLALGLNIFEIVVTSLNGVTTIYKVNIVRLPKEASDSTITDIIAKPTDPNVKPGESNKLPEINTDYTADKNSSVYPLPSSGKEGYTVANSINEVEFKIGVNIPTNPEFKATVKVYNSGKEVEADENGFVLVNLEVGMNNVIIISTAADKVTSTYKIIKIFREQMKLEVKSNSESVQIQFDAENTNGGKLTEDGFIYDDIETQHYYFKADGTKNLKAEDFANFVVVHDPINGEKVTKTVVTSEKGNEVVVTVTDGDQTRVIHFQLVDAQMGGGIGNMQIWIIGIVAIILLTAILISVNRQKYGRISNKRKA